jgi:purine-nucleoside phosphorylase
VTGADTLRAAFPSIPPLAITLGSGLGALVDALDDPVAVPFSEVSPLPSTGVVGHDGCFVFGRLDGIEVVVQSGRIHAYEGYPTGIVVAPIRILADLGVEAVILTNAAGGIRPGLEPGDLLLVEDHINLSFRAPLTGSVLEGEERFPDMSAPFDPELRMAMRQAALDEGIDLTEGTYAGVHGPSFETRAEVRMLGHLGADVVGMSTVAEVIVARARGLRVAGLSLVTNRATGLATQPLGHQEVLEVGREAAGRTVRLLTSAVRRIVSQPREGQPGGAK